MNDDKVLLVLTTLPDAESAGTLANHLVDAALRKIRLQRR